MEKSEIEKIHNKISVYYPGLLKDIDKNKKMLILDEYAVTGFTIGNRYKVLGALGAKQIIGDTLCDEAPEWYKSRDKITRKKLARDFKKLAEEIAEEIK